MEREFSAPGVKRFATLLMYSVATWSALTPLLALQWWRNNLGMPNHPTWLRFLGIVFATYVAFAMLTPVLFMVVRAWPVRKPWILKRSAMYVAGGLGFVLLAPAIRLLLLPPWDEYHSRFVPRTLETYTNLLTSRFADCTIAYLMLLAAAHAFELHDRTRVQQIEQSELRKTLAESELQMLKTQLHPHFLFNTLQGISSLTQNNPRLAKEMIVALGELLRAALKHATTDLVTLETEMGFIAAYLELEKMRLGEKLQVKIAVPRAAKECLVPQLLLQPLVENAIVHGIANCRAGGWIEISSELNEEQLRIRITNSVAAVTPEVTGVGLSNTRARLAHLYEQDARLTFRFASATVAEALVVIPALRGQSACLQS